MIEELITYVTEHGTTIAIWTSIFGIPIGLGAIAISIKIFKNNESQMDRYHNS